MPASDPPQSSPSPGSTPPASSSGNPPASTGTITQALDAVKAAFPADSSALFDLQVSASDDTTVSITVIFNEQPKYNNDQIDPINDAIAAQFQQLNIGQAPVLTYQWSPDPDDDDDPDEDPDSGNPDSGDAGGDS